MRYAQDDDECYGMMGVLGGALFRKEVRTIAREGTETTFATDGSRSYIPFFTIPRETFIDRCSQDGPSLMQCRWKQVSFNLIQLFWTCKIVGKEAEEARL